MAVVIIRHKVKDFATWKAAFDAHKNARDGAGFSKSRVLRSADDPSVVVLILDVTDLGKARAFSTSADLQAAMQRAGVLDKPDFFFLDDAG